MRLAPTALVLAALLLAGCSDDGAPLATPDPSATGPPDDAVAGQDTPAAPVVTVLAIDWDGQTKEGAWLCSDQDGTGQCMAGQQVAPDGAHVHVVPYGGNVTLVDINMTWQADPSQTGLVLAAYGNTSAGRGLLAHVRGPAPLRLVLAAADLAQVVPDNAIVLMVWPEGKTPTEPSVYVDATRQAFTVAGRLEATMAPTPA